MNKVGRRVKMQRDNQESKERYHSNLFKCLQLPVKAFFPFQKSENSPVYCFSTPCHIGGSCFSYPQVTQLMRDPSYHYVFFLKKRIISLLYMKPPFIGSLLWAKQSIRDWQAYLLKAYQIFLILSVYKEVEAC